LRKISEIKPHLSPVRGEVWGRGSYNYILSKEGSKTGSGEGASKSITKK